MAERAGLGGFILRAVLWLVPAFALWAMCGGGLASGVARPLESLLTMTWPTIFRAVEVSGHEVDIVTHLSARLLPGIRLGPGSSGEVVFSIDILKYNYGLPLLLGLCLAVPGLFWRRLRCFAIGAVVVFAATLWGVYWEALMMPLFRLGDAVSASVGTGDLMRNGVVLAYQLGFLVFPAMSAVLAWTWMNMDFLREQVLPRQGAVKGQAF